MWDETTHSEPWWSNGHCFRLPCRRPDFDLWEARVIGQCPSKSQPDCTKVKKWYQQMWERQDNVHQPCMGCLMWHHSHSPKGDGLHQGWVGPLLASVKNCKLLLTPKYLSSKSISNPTTLTFWLPDMHTSTNDDESYSVMSYRQTLDSSLAFGQSYKGCIHVSL